EAAAVAAGAADVGVGEELQLDLLVSGPAAMRAGAGNGVERERRGPQPAAARVLGGGEGLATRIEHPHVCRRVHARAAAEPRLVDEHRAFEEAGALERLAPARLGFRQAELPAQVPVQDLVDER